MISAKLIILFGLFAVALGFTIPDQENDLDNPNHFYEAAFGDEQPEEDNVVLIRNARSPQGRIGGSYGEDRFGKSASVYYKHKLNTNYEVYGEAARHFGRNDNSAMLGLQYNF